MAQHCGHHDIALQRLHCDGVVTDAGRVSVWKLLQSCHALRNEMAHLCGQLQAYLMFEVLERAWVELTDRLASVTHLDDLIGMLVCKHPAGCSVC